MINQQGVWTLFNSGGITQLHRLAMRKMCSKPYFFKKNMKKWLIKNEIPSSCIIDIHNVYSKSSITPEKKKKTSTT